MRARLVSVSQRSRRRLASGCLLTPAWPGRATADGQNNYANAQASGGQLTVQAGRDPLDTAGRLVVGEAGRE